MCLKASLGIYPRSRKESMVALAGEKCQLTLRAIYEQRELTLQCREVTSRGNNLVWSDSRTLSVLTGPSV